MGEKSIYFNDTALTEGKRRMGAGGSNSVTSIYPPDEKHLQRQLETPNGVGGNGWTPLSVNWVPVQKHLALRPTDKLREKKQPSRPNVISA